MATMAKIKDAAPSRLVSAPGLKTPLGQLHGAWIIANRRQERQLRVFGSYGLMYILEGDGVYRDATDAAGTARKVCAGDLILVCPSVAHMHCPTQKECWVNLDIIFAGPVFDFLQQTGVIDPDRPIYRLEQIDHWLGEFMRFLEQPRPTTEAEALVDVAQFLALLTKIVATQPRDLNTTMPNWLALARFHLESELDKEHSVSFVADEIGLSYENFRKLFERHVGMPPARYRAQKRMEVACRLLQTTSMSVKEVAESLGYATPYSFSNGFKEAMGVAPREYRHRDAVDQ